MNINPILESMIDDDLYKITQGAVYFHYFPRAIGTYTFFNRGKTQFPPGFAEELREQVIECQTLQLTADEGNFLHAIPYMRPTYIEWLSGFQLNPREVAIHQDGGDLFISIHGPLYRIVYWEVKLMAIISELYFKMTGQSMSSDWQWKIVDKATRLSTAGCKWIDFGTRRRYSKEVQDEVVRVMANKEGFLGTSNPHLAHKYGLTAHGTYAHEAVMAMSARYNARTANKMWMEHWSEYYDGNVGIALTDTFTTNQFLKEFGTYEARLFDGCRHDSSDPIQWGHKILNHYTNLKVPASNKKLVFSDNLNVDKYIVIHNTFKNLCQPLAGIGTHFTNDVGVKPLNMVIKLTSVDFGNGDVNVVKLSDDLGKNTGDQEEVQKVKKELGIV